MHKKGKRARLKRKPSVDAMPREEEAGEGGAHDKDEAEEGD